MKTKTELTCSSWISGKHSDTIEINTRLPFVSIGDYFWQGDEADKVIEEINTIYNNQDCTPLDACLIYQNLYL